MYNNDYLEALLYFYKHILVRSSRPENILFFKALVPIPGFQGPESLRAQFFRISDL